MNKIIMYLNSYRRSEWSKKKIKESEEIFAGK
jgi:hypothetical protein